MKYRDVNLSALLCGITVKSPEDRSEIAVIENLTSEYHIGNLRPVLYELEKAGVKNLVIDLSKFAPESRWRWLAFLEGAIGIGSDFNTKYIGTNAEEIRMEERDDSYREYLFPKIAGSLEEAVNSF